MSNTAKKGSCQPFIGVGDVILRLNCALRFDDSDLTVANRRHYMDEPCETVDVLASLLQTDFEIVLHPSDRVHAALRDAFRSLDPSCRRFDIYEVDLSSSSDGEGPLPCEKRTCVLTDLKKFSDAHGMIRLSGHFTPVSLTEDGFALLSSDGLSLVYSETGTF